VNEQDPAAAGRQPTEEELRAAMEEQMRRIRVQDVVLQTVATLVNLGGRRLGLAPEAADERDLQQAHLAIEATRALLPLLGPEEARAVREALSQLQVAYAREAGGQSAEAEAPPGAGESPADAAPAQGAEGSAQGGERPQQSSRDEAERAKARSRIWTPPGS
jgi:hypothetical protein